MAERRTSEPLCDDSNVVRLTPRMHRLALLRHRISRGAQLLADQQACVRELRADGHDTAQAEAMLVKLEDAQLALFEVLALLEEEDALAASLT
jgi:hypothetical protein